MVRTMCSSWARSSISCRVIELSSKILPEGVPRLRGVSPETTSRSIRWRSKDASQRPRSCRWMIHCALRLDARQQLQLGQDYSSRLEEVAIEQEAQRQYDEDLCTAVRQQTLEQVNE